MKLWDLRILQPHLTSQAYAKLLIHAREKPSLKWLTSDWFFEDEILTSKEELELAIMKIKARLN